MGIVEQELANFELSDSTEFRIEHNRNGIIHIHIDMTPNEFEHFVKVVSEAKHNLISIKELER